LELDAVRVAVVISEPLVREEDDRPRAARTGAAAARARSRNAMSGAEFFEREAELVTVGVEN